MTTFIASLVAHFTTGASIGVGVGCMLLSKAIGPAAMVVNSQHPYMAGAVFLYALAAVFGIGFLTAAFVISADH